MISPHTPPGTPLVVSWLPETAEELQRHLVPNALVLKFKVPVNLKLGQRVVLNSIQLCNTSINGFNCCVAEAPGTWLLACFTVATLPSCLTDCLVGKPVDADPVLPCDC